VIASFIAKSKDVHYIVDIKLMLHYNMHWLASKLAGEYFGRSTLRAAWHRLDLFKSLTLLNTMLIIETGIIRLVRLQHS
jgi:hypothetical protein